MNLLDKHLFQVALCYIPQQLSITASFTLDAKPVHFLRKAIHHCNMSIIVPRYNLQDIHIFCSESIHTYYGFFNNPCLESGKNRV